MKILFYIHSLGVGGAEMLVANYAMKLQELGYEIIIVEDVISDSFLQKEVNKKHIKTYALFSQNGNSLLGRGYRNISKLYLTHKWRSIIKAESPDIVHVHTSFLNYRKVFPLQQTFFTFHAAVERTFDLLGKKNSEKIKEYAKEGMNFIAISNNIKKDISELLHTQKVYYIPNGLDTNSVQKRKYNKEEFCKSIGLPSNAFLVGHVGRYNIVKNHEKVISVFYEIKKIKENAVLLLVGGGDKSNTDRINHIIEKSGLSDCIVQLGVRDDAIEIESCLDVLLLPSFSESFSLTLVEAQLHNVRCIASINVPDDVVCNSNCFRLDTNENDKKWAELSVSNITRLETKDINAFDISSVLDDTLKLYRVALNQKGINDD